MRLVCLWSRGRSETTHTGKAFSPALPNRQPPSAPSLYLCKPHLGQGPALSRKARSTQLLIPQYLLSLQTNNAAAWKECWWDRWCLRVTLNKNWSGPEAAHSWRWGQQETQEKNQCPAGVDCVQTDTYVRANDRRPQKWTLEDAWKEAWCF